MPDLLEKGKMKVDKTNLHAARKNNTDSLSKNLSALQLRFAELKEQRQSTNTSLINNNNGGQPQEKKPRKGTAEKHQQLKELLSLQQQVGTAQINLQNHT
jgi:hypothetical protein